MSKNYISLIGYVIAADIFICYCIALLCV